MPCLLYTSKEELEKAINTKEKEVELAKREMESLTKEISSLKEEIQKVKSQIMALNALIEQEEKEKQRKEQEERENTENKDIKVLNGKNQVFDKSKQKRISFRISTDVTDFKGAYPVSYTHLDVYKRQKLHLLQGESELHRCCIWRKN